MKSMVFWNMRRAKFSHNYLKRILVNILIKKANWVNVKVCPKGLVDCGDSVSRFEDFNMQMVHILQESYL